MIGIEAMAFNNPNLDKVQGIYSEVSHSIERPLDAFDRSHARSVGKKQAKLAVLKTDQLVDQIYQMVRAGQHMASVLRNGSYDDIQKLELRSNSAEVLGDLVHELTVGNHRLAYTFFKAESDGSWLPHIAHLKYIKIKAMQAFEEYKKVTEELHHLATLYLTEEDEGFSFDMETLSSSIESDTVAHPEWVKTGDDFAGWIKSLKKDA